MRKILFGALALATFLLWAFPAVVGIVSMVCWFVGWYSPFPEMTPAKVVAGTFWMVGSFPLLFIVNVFAEEAGA